MNTAMAIEFLARCFVHGETIAILLRRENPTKIAQRIVTLEQAVAPKYLRWLAHQNASGLNVYVAANPLRSGSRRRTKENIAAIRHLYLDIDFDGDARVSAVRASDAVPLPTAVIASSSGKYQIIWRVEAFDFAAQEHTLKLLAITFGGDPACTDRNRVIRVPGFHNCKYAPVHPVTVEYVSDTVSNPEHFRLAHGAFDAVLPLRGIVRRSPTKERTHSEQDWAWVLAELTRGTDAAQLTKRLALRRTDKPNPRYYAQRTVDLASAHLALLAGTPIHEVITALEERRRSEFPALSCSARAREIAQTAARTIAHKKIA